MIDIPVEHPQNFVAAVAAFWSDATYIWPRHESLEARLVIDRATRTWRSQAS
jgi:hypothetical protein